MELCVFVFAVDCSLVCVLVIGCVSFALLGWLAFGALCLVFCGLLLLRVGCSCV